MLFVCLFAAHGLIAQSVGPREFDNAHTLHIDVGASYLDRADLLASPGLSLTVSHYLNRSFALDYLNANLLFTFEKPEAAEIRRATGYIVAREPPQALVSVGARYAFGYGKLLIEHSGAILHFVPELALHVGLMVNGGSVHPEADVSLALRVKVARYVEVGADVSVIASIEGDPVAGVWGVMPRLFVGAVF